MRVLTFLNALGLGGTEKAAVHWCRGLRERGHEVGVLALHDGPRREELEAAGLEVCIEAGGAARLAAHLAKWNPEVIHAHAPGFPNEGDVLGEALSLMGRKIPVVQTNIFGRLENPREDAWTDFRLFISWTSCVQAARRAFLPLDEAFFRDKGVAVYPVDPVPESRLQELREEADRLRERLGIAPDEVLFGRFSRPEPNKWTNLPLRAFTEARKTNPRIKLLLREPPPAVAERLLAEGKAWRPLDGECPEDAGLRPVLILPATSDAGELQISQMACDVVLHGSSIGESFGYGLAELMVLGKPAIANSVPWGDQAQIELVRHGECGFITATVSSTARAILQLAGDESLRRTFGERAKGHIVRLADPKESLAQVERALHRVTQPAGISGGKEACVRAADVVNYLDLHQFGHDFGEWVALRPFYWRVRFHQWRRQRLKFQGM